MPPDRDQDAAPRRLARRAWDGVRGGTVRTAARLAAATPDQLAAARARLTDLAEPHRDRRGYALPITIRIATAFLKGQTL